MRIDDLDFHVVMAGPVDGPLVLLLHGFPEFWYGWREQMPALAAAGYHVWAPDQRGYNRSAKPLGVNAYDIGQLASDVVGMIDASGRRQVHLVGHDWGAAVAWWVAGHCPERLASLTILNVLSGAGDIYPNLLFLADLFTFLALELIATDPAEPVAMENGLRQRIALANITFQYPHIDRVALQDFNMSIPAGKLVTIVGENGGGKSTLLKLLCRFYDPQQGAITWDGADLRDQRRRIGVLFQQPMPYHETVTGNIRFGDINGAPSQADLIHVMKVRAAWQRWQGTVDLDHLPGEQYHLLPKPHSNLLRMGVAELADARIAGVYRRCCGSAGRGAQPRGGFTRRRTTP